MTDRDALVVGAGVSGLTTAVCLAEAGWRVRIRAAGTDEATTSYAAGATWSPYLVESSERARRWSYETLTVMRELAGVAGAGITLRSGVELAPEPPPWRDRLQDYRPIESGWRMVAPVVDMPAYLGYLRRRAAASGATVELGRVASLAELDAPLVVNCTGIGARDLVPDATLVPVRGQVVIVENPGITEFFVEESDPPVYFFPQGDTVVLGGTAERGDDRVEPDPDVAARIVARCARVDPRLGEARIVGHRVGLRPTRPEVCLERTGRVIHNYGHGGAGVTLSWGCAREVTRLAG